MESRKLIIFLDCGDTIIDEGTEMMDKNQVVLDAELLPGADIMVKTLAEKGYRLALVADGLAQSFKNTLTKHGLYDCFEAMIYSECVKATKPSIRMFKAAMGALELGENDLGRIVMVGNNLERDIRGANGAGIVSVHLSGSPRYPNTPADESEKPDYTIQAPVELIDLAERLNEQLLRGECIK